MRSFSWILPVLFLFAAASPAAALPALYAAGSVRHAIRLPDGSIIVTGYFTTVGETARPGIAKLLPNGQLDEDWTASGFALPAVRSPTPVFRKRGSNFSACRPAISCSRRASTSREP